MSPLDQHAPSAGVNPFTDLTEATAPAAAQPLLAQAREIFGFVPNLAVVMATEPATLGSYFQALQAFGQTSLSPIEQQVVLMAVSRVNRADYSLAVHATLAAKLGAPADVVKAVGTGAPVADPRLAALRRFAEMLTIGRGEIASAELTAFLAAGYDRKAVVAVAFGIAAKTFANALAHLARTPVDEPFESALAELRH
jgi:AhpD family alkylhydroperoxidase